MTVLTYRVEGMTCASCVRRVEKALLGIPGVSEASVNLATEEANITGEGLTEEQLQQALQARGYALHPIDESPDLETSQRVELVRVIAAWLLTLPLMIPMIPNVHWEIPGLLQAVLAGVVIGGPGGSFFANALKQLRHREVTMDTLVALGASVSWLFGMAEVIQNNPHPPFETGAALVAFLLVGKHLEARAKHRATDSLEALLDLAPPVAVKVERNGKESLVFTRLLRPGDRVKVTPGSAIPVDGVVCSGSADVEEALLTGEPMPVPRKAGDPVLAGAVVHGGVLEVEVQGAGRDTWLARLAQQVAEAQGSRTPAQDLADRISSWFVPAILVLSALTLAFWWFKTGALGFAWRPAVTVLVIACPCALGLATPVAMAAALGTAARLGLLVKDARAMERLGQVTDLVFDKTGTLTQGHPVVSSVLPSQGQDRESLLRLAAALEQGSEHPVAKGILQAAQGLVLPRMEDFRAHPGSGVTGRALGRDLRLGSEAFLGLPFPPLPAEGTAVGLAEGPHLLGVMVLKDALRPEALPTVRTLQARGLRLHLLSGDRPEAAEDLGRTLGLQEAQGGCSPQAKRDRIQELQVGGAVVAFVGDGINDAPALAQADAGVSLAGLEAAHAAAPLNLLRGGLDPLLKAHRLARRARSIVFQNLVWAFGYNLVLVPLAACNQLDRFGGPMLAGAAMGLSSLTVVLNALRLRRA